MLYSQLFGKTIKNFPKDEVSLNAQLLIKAGFIHKEMAGVYTYLPLGLKTLNNISNLLRIEMNAIGGQEMLLTTLQEPSLWEKTGRWSDDEVDVWFKTKLKNETVLGLGLTHEEPLTAIATKYVQSYRDLPLYVYQLQNKFRNETRSKSGILRGREFLMKDLYSFNRTMAELDEFYEACKKAYLRFYDEIGLGEITYLTFASGGSFSKYSHEFQTLSDAGEDIIYLDRNKQIAVNVEVYNDEILENLGLKKGDLEEVKAIETGNIFKLGTKYSEPLGLEYTDESGERHPVIMGCYGIGVGRAMGTIVEAHFDDRGIVWPDKVAPYTVHLVTLGHDEVVFENSAKLYSELQDNNIDVLWDERHEITAGEKFADADLIGIPWRVVVSPKTMKEEKIEIKPRSKSESWLVTPNQLIDSLVRD